MGLGRPEPLFASSGTIQFILRSPLGLLDRFEEQLEVPKGEPAALSADRPGSAGRDNLLAAFGDLIPLAAHCLAVGRRQRVGLFDHANSDPLCPRGASGGLALADAGPAVQPSNLGLWGVPAGPVLSLGFGSRLLLGLFPGHRFTSTGAAFSFPCSGV